MNRPEPVLDLVLAIGMILVAAMFVVFVAALAVSVLWKVFV